METLELVFGIILLVAAVFLIVSVLLQSSKDSRMSGVIAGAGETFLGKERNSRLDKFLNKVTPIVAGVFGVIVIVMYIIVA